MIRAAVRRRRERRRNLKVFVTFFFFFSHVVIIHHHHGQENFFKDLVSTPTSSHHEAYILSDRSSCLFPKQQIAGIIHARDRERCFSPRDSREKNGDPQKSK